MAVVEVEELVDSTVSWTGEEARTLALEVLGVKRKNQIQPGHMPEDKIGREPRPEGYRASKPCNSQRHWIRHEILQVEGGWEKKEPADAGAVALMLLLCLQEVTCSPGN